MSDAVKSAMKTFDCPWCGAITPVPIEHMGEHFKCPECKKATKLTVANTSDGPPTQAPAGAPHLIGDRTFDCPWCGAIAAVPSTHLGDRFHCPECEKETKLTAMNTRAAVITAPPPDAPHIEPAGRGRGVLVALLVAAAAVGGWFVFGRGGGKEDDKGNAPAANGSGSESASTDGASPAGPASAPSASTPSSGTPPAPGSAAMNEMPVAPTSSPAAPPPMPAKPEADPELLRAQGELSEAMQAWEVARGAQVRAEQAIAQWKAAHPGAEDAAAAASAIAEVKDGVAKTAADKAIVPDPAKLTPQQARAARAAIVTFLAASPARTSVAERVHAWLRSDLQGREGVFAADWKAIDWRGEGARRALSSLTAAASAAAATLPQELVSAEAASRAALADAAARREKAELRVKLLSAPRDDRPPAPPR